MNKTLYTLTLLVLSLIVQAQPSNLVWVKYTPDFTFNDGIYLDFEQVKGNNPIPKTRIMVSENLTNPLFFDKILSGKKIFYFDENGLRKEVATEKIWGFSNKGVIYINMGGNFNKISIVGSICHFIATVTVVNQQYYDPFYNGYSAGYNVGPSVYAVQETRQFLLDFKTGTVFDYSYENVSLAIASDSVLAKEYAAMKKRKQKDLKFLYIRKYNERNPLLIPVKSNQ